jgi:hypothetical protein
MIGDDRFDHAYKMRTNDPLEVKNLLTHGVRFQIEELRRLFGNDDVYVAIQSGCLLIRKRVRIRVFEELEHITQQAIALYDQAMLTRSIGIEFLDHGSAQIINDATCQVCGDGIEEEMVVCCRCKTPHHQDCWQYYGACSTYGCQETRFCAPRAAESTPDHQRHSTARSEARSEQGRA